MLILWSELADKINESEISKKPEYKTRLDFELEEVNKQGANQYWIDLYNAGEKFDDNKNGLVLPFVLGITDVDPIQQAVPHKIERQPDMPDIDIDLLPIARDPVKKYAADKYGSDHVCVVGSWLTYKPKLSLKDAASALGKDVNEVMNLTSELPDEIDDMTCEEALLEFPKLKAYADEHPDVVRIAYALVGRIKAQGRHAGGLIISSVPVKQHIPSSYLGKEGKKEWVSTWTEGHSPQLSKFGFVKFDLLGLTTLGWIWQACNLIKKNRKITIKWDDIDPDIGRAGWEIHPDDTKVKIEIDDESAMKMADELKTESIFQFETDLAKSILKNGVNTLNDLIIYTSLGRPGPLPLVDVYCRRRDGDEDWESDEHPEIKEILKDTYGVIVFQEQLSEMWHKIAGFTIPEAEAARKAVAKKWVDKLEPVKNKWISGASRLIGEAKALKWHEKMVTFGRYAFNLSHAVAYGLISQRCLYLKAHYPHEWWASVMSQCKADKLIKYMGIARSEKVKFGEMRYNKLSLDFDVDGDLIIPGLKGIKGVGAASAPQYCGIDEYNTFDEFVLGVGKDKIIFERLIRLGAFDQLESDRKLLWTWYTYKYGSGKIAIETRKEINERLAWTDEQIKQERIRLIDEYKLMYPNKKKLPKRILEWRPKKPKANNIEDIRKTMQDGYTTKEILSYEKEYLGYYLSSPLDEFETLGSSSVVEAKKSNILECIVDSMQVKRTKKGNEYVVLTVTDGIELVRVTLWQNDIESMGEDLLEKGVGLRIFVEWSDRFNTFTVIRGHVAIPLSLKGDHAFTN